VVVCHFQPANPAAAEHQLEQMAEGRGSPHSSMALRRTASSGAIRGGTLRKTGEVTVRSGGRTTDDVMSDGEAPPKLPRYLDVKQLGARRKLSNSTGNLHGCMAGDYSRVNWPLPKMFGDEKYAYSLIDIDDPRHVKDCASLSKKLIRLQYDQQIVDLEWRKVYKALLDAEHKADLPDTAKDETKRFLKKEVDRQIKYLLELQEQKDMYEDSIQSIYAKCDAIKAELKKEADLEDLRCVMEKSTKDKIAPDSPFWRTKFNCRSQRYRDNQSLLDI